MVLEVVLLPRELKVVIQYFPLLHQLEEAAAEDVQVEELLPGVQVVLAVEAEVEGLV